VPALSRLGGGRLKRAWAARALDPGVRESFLLACWILGPLLFFSLNQSKLPQYILPLLPALALAAARGLSHDGLTSAGWRTYVALAALLAAILVAVERFVPLPITMTEAQRLAIPPTALAIAAALAASALVVAGAARRDSVELAAAGFALVVVSVPFVGQPLLRAVGEDRSAAKMAEALQGAGEVVMIGTWRNSLPFYLGRPPKLATADGTELTSNWIADHVEEYRALPDGPILPLGAWRRTLGACPAATVFVAAAGDSVTRGALSALPLLYEDSKSVAFGPCPPRPPR
jgi:4-amino-4-deoxy-L-arabinose transferase-like glycosyltransferase